MAGGGTGHAFEKAIDTLRLGIDDWIDRINGGERVHPDRQRERHYRREELHDLRWTSPHRTSSRRAKARAYFRSKRMLERAVLVCSSEGVSRA